MSDIQFPVKTEPYVGQQQFFCEAGHIWTSGKLKPKCPDCKKTGYMAGLDPNAKWDFTSQEVFLTHSQTHKRLTPEVAMKKIQKSIGTNMKKNAIKHYLISREKHQDGNYHLHTYLKFEKRFRTQNHELFDLKMQTIHKPQWQKVRGNRHRLFYYIKKDKEWNGDTGWISNFETKPQIIEIVENVSSWEEYYIAIAHISDGFWRMKAGEQLMKLKLGGSVDLLQKKAYYEDEQHTKQLREQGPPGFRSEKS